MSVTIAYGLNLVLMIGEIVVSVPVGAFALGCVRLCGQLRHDEAATRRAAILFTAAVILLYVGLLADIIRRLLAP
jgi:hypothetical protein